MSEGWISYDGGTARLSPILLTTSIVFLAFLVGAVIPVYVGAVGDGLARLMALPALILLFFLFVLSRKTLLLVILFFRASADLVLESSKLSVGGHQIGAGALINAAVLAVAMLLVLEKPDVIPKKIITIMWAAFLLTAFYGMLIAPLKVDAIRTYLVLSSYLAIFVSAFYFVRTARDFGFCVRIVLWSSLIPALYALVDIALNGHAVGLSEIRVQSTFTHPNIFAFYLTLIISLALYMLKSSSFSRPAWKRAGLTAYILFLLSLLILTKTRSAWIACFAIILVYGLIFERRYLAYLVLVPILALLIPGIRDRLLDLGTGNEYVQYAQLNSFAWRRMIWESGLKWMEPERYVLGYGIDSFKYYAPIFFPLAGNVNFGAHNVYVQWLFEVGTIGLLAYLWLFGRLLWVLRLLAPMDKLAAFVSIALIIEYLTISFSDNMFSYLAFNWYFWFILGAACAVVVVEKRRSKESQSPATQSGRVEPNAEPQH